MTAATRLADASRTDHLRLRRVERLQLLVDLLHGWSRRATFAEVGRELGVCERTVARDVERLRVAGVPLDVVPGRGGGVLLDGRRVVEPIVLDGAEVAAVLASLVTLGPSLSPSATSATRKLLAALG